MNVSLLRPERKTRPGPCDKAKPKRLVLTIGRLKSYKYTEERYRSHDKPARKSGHQDGDLSDLYGEGRGPSSLLLNRQFQERMCLKRFYLDFLLRYVDEDPFYSTFLQRQDPLHLPSWVHDNIPWNTAPGPGYNLKRSGHHSGKPEGCSDNLPRGLGCISNHKTWNLCTPENMNQSKFPLGRPLKGSGI